MASAKRSAGSGPSRNRAFAAAPPPTSARRTLADAEVGHFVTMTDGSVVRLAAVINGALYVRGNAGAGSLEFCPRSTPILDSRAPSARGVDDDAPVRDPLTGTADREPDLFHNEAL
jgi:hypothetical protein